MMHFVTRSCAQLIHRLSFGRYSKLKQKTLIGLINSNKYVPLLYFRPKWMSTSAHYEAQAENLGEKLKIYFKIPKTGEIVEATAREGQTVMSVAVVSDVNMQGACEGSLSCTTCHVYVPDDLFDRLPEPVLDEEDLLDVAPFHKLTSRLSCQIVLTKDMEGAVFELPYGTKNMQIDKNHRKESK